MFLAKRTPEVPRCGSWLPKALCIFQRTLSCAFASVVTAVSAKADSPTNPINSVDFIILQLLPSLLAMPTPAAHTATMVARGTLVEVVAQRPMFTSYRSLVAVKVKAFRVPVRHGECSVRDRHKRTVGLLRVLCPPMAFPAAHSPRTETSARPVSNSSSKQDYTIPRPSKRPHTGRGRHKQLGQDQ